MTRQALSMSSTTIPPCARDWTRLLRSAGLAVEAFASAAEFLARDGQDGVGCIVLDVRMPGISGMDLQADLVAQGIDLPVIFLTGHGDIPMSVEAMKTGALDFLTKPVDEEVLLTAVRQALHAPPDRAVRTAGGPGVTGAARVPHLPRAGGAALRASRAPSTSRSPPTSGSPRRPLRFTVPGSWRRWARPPWRSSCKPVSARGSSPSPV